MNNKFSVYGIKTDLVSIGDDLGGIIIRAVAEGPGLEEGDILVVAESALATSEGHVTELSSIIPTPEAERLAVKYEIDPRLAGVILSESDSVVGGIPGFLLCMKQGTLLPNAGIDGSNAPPGAVVCLPPDPDGSAAGIRDQIKEKLGIRVGVIVADSRTHAMRMGCGAVAMGCAGLISVTDERGKEDLFGRQLEVTRRAIADNIACAAELVMGEADECTPAAVIRGLGVPMTEDTGVETIEASECLFMGVAMHANPALLNGDRETKSL